MVNEARLHESDDRQRRAVEARNTADNLAYQTEKTLRDLGDKLPLHERQEIERKTQELREAIEGSDITRLRNLTEDLQNAFHAISQQIYSQQPGTNGNGYRPADSEDEGEVVEENFTSLIPNFDQHNPGQNQPAMLEAGVFILGYNLRHRHGNPDATLVAPSSQHPSF
jgi:hypothetical protein